MWDAMLSEGRHFWFFASSDWHNRGAFGPLDYETTNDFYPGEYQEQFSYVVDRPNRDPAQDIIDSLRSGNTFSVQGQLITGDFKFQACASGSCATMGETLYVRRGENVEIVLEMIDPDEPNNSPYNFPNPALKQIGVEQPLNNPAVAQVDLITGQVGRPFSPKEDEYYNPLAPASTQILESWGPYEIRTARRGKDGEEIKLKTRMRVYEDSYVRARGSNIPAGTPNKRDLEGNPLRDDLNDNIACDDPECPPHVGGILTADVEAWSDVWFYANPIFIEVGSGGGKTYDDDDDDSKGKKGKKGKKDDD
jgi:hypothetical protein